MGLYGMSFWMPQVIPAFGLSPLAIGFATAIPYFFATIAMVLWGAHSDRTGERIWHVALPLLVGGAAFAWSASPLSLVLILVALPLWRRPAPMPRSARSGRCRPRSSPARAPQPGSR